MLSTVENMFVWNVLPPCIATISAILLVGTVSVTMSAGLLVIAGVMVLGMFYMAAAGRPLHDDYADKAALRKAKATNALQAPADFGHEHLIAQKDWGMLGNDDYGCCFWSGAGHEERIWGYEGGDPASINTASTLQSYAECTGFDITKTDAQGNNSTDQVEKILSLFCYNWLQAHEMCLVASIFDSKCDDDDARLADVARHALQGNILCEDDT